VYSLLTSPILTLNHIKLHSLVLLVTMRTRPIQMLDLLKGRRITYLLTSLVPLKLRLVSEVQLTHICCRSEV